MAIGREGMTFSFGSIMSLKLEDLGCDEKIDQLRIENNLQNYEIGRVILEHKERYIVRTDTGEFEAEITGSFRFSAAHREDYPAVGDWVAITCCDSSFAIIHKILPRFSMISRQAVGQFGESQVIATNIDYALIVQGVGHNFNMNRLERYLVICNSSKVKPIVILTKTDLIDEDEKEKCLEMIRERMSDVPVYAISNETQEGYEFLKEVIQKGKTYCMLGSSGVGKSSLLNNLSGKSIMKTGKISESTNKGRHITSHRELFVLENGGILIDNPGMREVGISDCSDGLETTFDVIYNLSLSCKFKDCTHTTEMGCCVIESLNNGELSKAVYDHYQKMQKEKEYFETSVVEKRKKEKAFGKMIKNYHKMNVKNDI